MKPIEKNIGFIGAGNMATAIISGLLKDGYKNSQIYASCPEDDHLNKLSSDFAVNVSKKNEDVLSSVSTLVLAVKPNVVETVLEELSSLLSEKKPLLISIVAGFQISSVESKLNCKIKIIRAMPNTPASLGLGVSALTSNDQIKEEDKRVANSIFDSVGVSCWLEESSFDLFTALIGSGPAYIFYLIEALQEAAQGLNLEDNVAKELVVEMIKGSATLAGVSQDSPSLF